MKIFGSNGLKKIFKQNDDSEYISDASASAALNVDKILKENQKQKQKEAKKTSDKKENSKRNRRRLIIIFLVLVLLTMTAYGICRMIVRPPVPVIDDGDDYNEAYDEQKPPKGTEPNISAEKTAGYTRKNDYFTMLIACTDEDGTRTDSMILVSFDTGNKKVSLLNIPRDTMSDVSRNVRKINSAYAFGGIEQTKKEVKMITGLPVDRYAVFDFKAVEEVVNIIGGVTYDVPINMNYDDPTQNLHIHIKKGEQVLNGKDAVGVLRFRKNNGNKGGYANGDIGRIENLQNFIKALAKQVITPSTIPQIPDIAKAVFKNTKTDLKTGEMVWFGMQALGLDLDEIRTETLPGYSKSVYEPSIKLYQSYWIPKEKEILELINECFNPYNETITDIDVIPTASISRGSPTPVKQVDTPKTEIEQTVTILQTEITQGTSDKDKKQQTSETQTSKNSDAESETDDSVQEEQLQNTETGSGSPQEQGENEASENGASGGESVQENSEGAEDLSPITFE